MDRALSFNQNIPPLPPGFRFDPTDEELVDYLTKKIDNEPIPYNPIPDANVYRHSPSELAEAYPSIGKDEWYFFTPRDKKYLNGSRPNRAAGNGYWKATAADKPIYRNNARIGSKRSLVFFQGMPRNGKKTNWLMNEYTVGEPSSRRLNDTNNMMQLDSCVLCRIYKFARHSSRNENISLHEPLASPNLESMPPVSEINMGYDQDFGSSSSSMDYFSQLDLSVINDGDCVREGSPPYMKMAQFLESMPLEISDLEEAQLMYFANSGDDQEIFLGLDFNDHQPNVPVPTYEGNTDQEFDDFASFLETTISSVDDNMNI